MPPDPLDPLEPLRRLSQELSQSEPKKVQRNKRAVSQHTDRAVLLRWAQANIGVDPNALVLETIPSPAHASMLAFANSDTNNFWKLIAELDKKEQDQASAAKAFRDDNRRQFAFMDAVLEERARLAAST